MREREGPAAAHPVKPAGRDAIEALLRLALHDSSGELTASSPASSTPPALAALAAQRLGRAFDEHELDAVLAQLRSNALLDGEPAADGMSRRNVMLTGGGVLAASLITTILAPLPAAAQSPAPGPGPGPGTPGGPGMPCQTEPDCQTNLSCQSGTCCVPQGEPCTGGDCCPGLFCSEAGFCITD